ncbi:hypothetical protein WJX72_011513 [[Myrmecia] bisecta]|uniref:ABC transporter domain-containing protein n=1 Tax=[Myrmecia] bisecta TaxID=41462 RepID=A0AAW1Q6I0_9CHLO
MGSMTLLSDNSMDRPGVHVRINVAAAKDAEEPADQPVARPVGVEHKRNGLKITFRDIRYQVVNSTQKKEKLLLLNGITGCIAPGEMTALMGASGSGKTTLLDCLAGRKTAGQLEGEIMFAGRPPTQTYLRRHTGYVEQFDTLHGNLTVREMLMYTAELKILITQPMSTKRERVNSVIETLALTTCQNTKIGSALEKGISGGQAKRVNIGIALVTSPRVLFLDEPTSGLDSYTSNEVMAIVQALTRSNDSITVCAAIHSPTPTAFRLFDRMIILLRGRMVYFGEAGMHAMEYFALKFPDIKPFDASRGENEAEWLVDTTTRADRQGLAGDFADVYEASELRERNDAMMRGATGVGACGRGAGRASVMTLGELEVKQETSTPFWHALKTLLKYRMLTNFKDPKFMGPRIMDKITVTILMMSLYWGIGRNLVLSNILNIASLLYMWAILPGFAAMSYVPALVLERPLYIRERNDGLYWVITYLCSKMAEEIIIAFFCSLAFSCLVFFPVGFSGQWVLFWLVYWCTMSIGVALAYFVAAMSPNLDVANATVPAYVGSLLFFTGCLLRFADIPDYWTWYSYINFLRYAWGALMVNQFEHSEPSDFLGSKGVLDYYSLAGTSKWAFLGYEFAFFVSFFLLAYLALSYKKHGNR